MAAFAKDESPSPLTVEGDTPKNKGGRPVGSGTGTRMTADVKQALAVMDGIYDALASGLDFMEDEETVLKFRDKTRSLSERNRGYFEADPKLASRIAKLGSGGGTGAFLLANIVALGPFLIPAGVKAFSQIRLIFDMIMTRFAPEPPPEYTAPPESFHVSTPKATVGDPLGIFTP